MTFIIHSKKHGKHIVEIDDEDAECVLQYKWHLAYCYRHGHAYLKSVLTNTIKNNKRTKLLLHRLLVPNVTMIDHADGNVLNNCKNNLRACTCTENNRNSKMRVNNVSGFKGIYWHKREKKFYAQIGVNNQKIRLGLFKTKEAAALAYNEAAVKYFGEFARLNEIIDVAQ